MNKIITPAKNLFFCAFIFLLTLNPFTSVAQTTLSPGDMAIVRFITGGANDDGVAVVNLKELSCGTTFTITDNNWRTSTNAWYCIGSSDQEFAVGFTCRSTIPAGTQIFIETNPLGSMVVTPAGMVTYTLLTPSGTFGNNAGFNSGGDNCFIIQGTWASPSFIFGLRHVGTFSSGGDCTSKDNTGLPAALTLASTAIELPSSQDEWHYNGSLTTGSAAALLAAISNKTNWSSTAAAAPAITVVDVPFNPTGVLSITGAGCGCAASCNLSSVGGPNCGFGQTGNCTAGSQTVALSLIFPASTCTNIVVATIRPWNYISSSCGTGSGPGADSDNKLRVDKMPISKSLLTGSGDGGLNDGVTIVGAGTVQITGVMNRADEIVAYRVLSAPCTGCSLPTVLPIELKMFNAAIDGKNVLLRWTTSTEVQNDYFTIERSADAGLWEAITTVKGMGNSNHEVNYSVFDTSPLKGISYYRLKQTDYDTQSKYSYIVVIENKNTDERTLVKTVNIYGQETNENAKGLLIRVYDNGDTEKVYVAE